MKKFLLLLAILPAELFAQQQDCSWKPGTDIVCDSIAKRCSETAYVMTQRACGMKTSMFYDSLYCSEGYLIEFNFALRSFYNDLIDTLADFRTYLGWYGGMNKDSDTIITISVSYAGHIHDSNGTIGPIKPQIDSLCRSWNFRFLGKTENGSYSILKYSCPKMINRSYVHRHLVKYDTMVMVSGYYRPSPYDMIQVTVDDLSGDLITIVVCETSACMPPELPCEFIRRTFYAQREWSCRYVNFERGVIPWPAVQESLKED